MTALVSISPISAPEMFTSTPSAPRMSTFSSRGELMAARAAVSARSSPSALPVPMSATPLSCMTERTSAKSRFTTWGFMMMSWMPRVAS